VYVDAAGNRHAWRINNAHTLMWEDRAFIPVGGLFAVQSWTKSATDADFEADRAALAQLKTHGVTDLIVQSPRGGITAVSPAAIQRVLDVLDAEGFTYGISLNDGPRESLTAYEVRPGAYRQPSPEAGSQVRFPVDNLMSSLYFIVTPDGKDVVASGEAEMVSDGARVSIPANVGQTISFLVPEKMYVSGPGLRLPNLWDGYDTYRDSVLALFGQVHPGKGLRFFIDPLPENMDLTPEGTRLIPNSPGFVAEWQTYIAHKYRTLQTLDDAWSLTDRDVSSFAMAANLLPLWSGGKGIPLLYDKVTHAQHKTDSTRCAFWNDLRDFMTESVRGYMNGLSAALKRGVADVPVVYRAHGWSPLFSHLPTATDGAFDGIGIVSYGRGRDLITGGAGEVYAQASDAARTLWLPVAATALTEGGSAPTTAPGAKPEIGYPSRVELVNDLDQLRGIGARGFYLDSLRSLSTSSTPAPSLLEAPEQLDWLNGYGQALAAAASRAGSGNSDLDTLPGVTFFPRGLDMGSVRLLSNGEWWLPIDREAKYYDFGPTVRAYPLLESDGATTYYFWNPEGGTRTIRISMPKASRLPNAPRVSWSTSANGVVKKDILTLTIGPDPIRLMNYPTVPLPLESIEDGYHEGLRMLDILQRQKDLHEGLFRSQLSNAMTKYQTGDPWFGFSLLQKTLLDMRAILRDYAWLEAEGSADYPVNQSFDAIEDRPGASSGKVLVVERRPAGMPLATAVYNITVGNSGIYQLWVAASRDAPLTFQLDGQSMLDSGNIIGHVPSTPGAIYANDSLAWIHMGAVNLPKGTHLLEMRASGPAVVDTILLYKGDFVPNGATPPPVSGQ